jgi:hypothetical protein
MEKFIVLKDGTIFNLSTNKRLKIDITTSEKDIDIDKMGKTMTKFFSTMSKEEFLENWFLTISLLLKDEFEDEAKNKNLEDNLNEIFNETSNDLEAVKQHVTGDDMSSYVTAFILGRLFGKFEKNTGIKVALKYLDIDEDERRIIEDFMYSFESAADGPFVPEDDIFDGTAYFELDGDDFTEE